VDIENQDKFIYKSCRVYSIRKRKQIEECFGWMKDIGLMRKLRHRGQSLVNQLFLFTAAAYNLVRMRRLLA
jgi:hypothetical protein